MLIQLEASRRMQSCGGMGWSDNVSARQQHIKTLQSHYVSCWTNKPESVAMWSLYSPDYCGVQIKTSVEQIQAVLLNFLNEKSFAKVSQSDAEKHVVVASWMGIYPVSYVSLPCLLNKITRRVKAYERIKDRYSRLELDLPGVGNIPARFYKREQQRRLVVSDNKVCYLKDSSYEHEFEIRAVVRLGESKCDESLLKLRELLDPKHPQHDNLLPYFSEYFGLVEFTQLPRFEFPRCSKIFVQSVKIDPRCPPHKRNFMEKWFRERDIEIEESSCFGYIPKTFTVFPKN